MKHSIVTLCLTALVLHGCSSVAAPAAPPKLHDGRYGDYNEQMSEQCASAAMALGIEHGLSNSLIDSLFNKCVFDQGLTI